MKITRICETCRKEFEVERHQVINHNRGRFCSRECSKNGEIRTCEYCGKKFYKCRSHIARGDGHFCSHKCQAAKCKEDTNITITCERCGKPFTVKQRQLDRGTKFCSKSCARGNNTYVTKECKNCGKKFKIRSCYIKYNHGTFCSNKCRYDYFIGPNCPAWKGGLSFEKYCWKFNEKTKEAVRERFGRKCYLCKMPEIDNNGRKLNIHHCDYQKSAGCAGLLWSLLPLCNRDHSRTNHNRWYWFCLLRDFWIYKYPGFELWVNI